MLQKRKRKAMLGSQNLKWSPLLLKLLMLSKEDLFSLNWEEWLTLGLNHRLRNIEYSNLIKSQNKKQVFIIQKMAK